MPRTPSSTSTRYSTRSSSTSATVSSGSGEQRTSDTSSIATRPCRLATIAAEALLQEVRRSEGSDSEENLDGDSDAKADMELDRDEDSSMTGSDGESSSDGIELVAGELGLVAPTTKQGLVRVLALSRGARKKVPKEVIKEEEEEEPSDEEFGESVCWVRCLGTDAY